MDDDCVVVLDSSVEIIDLSGPSIGDDFIPVPDVQVRRGRGRRGGVSARMSSDGTGGRGGPGGAGRGRGGPGGAGRGRGAKAVGGPSPTPRGGGRGAASSSRGRGSNAPPTRGRGRGGRATVAKPSAGPSDSGTASQRGTKRKRSNSDEVEGEDPVDPVAPKRGRGRGRGKATVGRGVKTESTELAIVNVTAASRSDAVNLDESIAVIDQPAESTLIAEKLQLPPEVVAQVVRLLKDDNTVPFLARYRRDQVGHLSPDKLNEIQCMLNKIKVLHNRQSNALKNLANKNALTAPLVDAIRKSTSLAELEAVLEPLKMKKVDKTEEARKLGLESYAVEILEGKCVEISVIRDESGPIPEARAEAGISDIAAEMFAKDPVILDDIRPHVHASIIVAGTRALESATPKQKQLYSQFVGIRRSLEGIPAHQLLAIVRGEREKLLKSTIDLNEDSLKRRFEFSVRGRWRSCRWSNYEKIMMSAMNSSFRTFVVPLMKRERRAKAVERCEDVGIKDFSVNLKHLLLTPPIKGSSILGVDPGYTHGCKIGIVSTTGAVQNAFVIKPIFGGNEPERDSAAAALGRAVFTHSCQIFAVGNGKGSRDFHAWLQRLIVKRFFHPYVIQVLSISECGASIYSASKEAGKEFPGLDINLISAISLARRVLDPLSELVKVDPKHLGVGLYQHDMSTGALGDALDSVVTLCMSEVGADMNTASTAILQKIAGVGPSKAKAIVDFRDKHGPFTNRSQLLLVKDIGPKTFTQSCGFLRVLPSSAQGNVMVDKQTAAKAVAKARLLNVQFNMEFDPLDATMIHPESYRAARRLLQAAGVASEDVGTQRGIDAVRAYSESKPSTELAQEIGCAGEVCEHLVEALLVPLDYDCRNARELPAGFGSVMSVEDVRAGMKVVGRVSNVVQFGAFVDIGVGHDGLLHRSKIGEDLENELVLGSFAEFLVQNVKGFGDSYRIGLSFVRFV